MPVSWRARRPAPGPNRAWRMPRKAPAQPREDPSSVRVGWRTALVSPTLCGGELAGRRALRDRPCAIRGHCRARRSPRRPVAGAGRPSLGRRTRTGGSPNRRGRAGRRLLEIRFRCPCSVNMPSTVRSAPRRTNTGVLAWGPAPWPARGTTRPGVLGRSRPGRVSTWAGVAPTEPESGTGPIPGRTDLHGFAAHPHLARPR